MESSQLLQNDEELVLIVRKHWSVLAGTFLAALLVIVIPLGIPLFVKNIDPFLIHIFWFFYTIIIALLWTGCGFSIADFLLDAWVITDTRIIDIEQDGLFHRKIATIELKNVQNIVVEVSGINETMMHAGTLTIETAGEHGSCVFENVPYPEEVKQIILETSARLNNSAQNVIQPLRTETGAV